MHARAVTSSVVVLMAAVAALPSGPSVASGAVGPAAAAAGPSDRLAGPGKTPTAVGYGGAVSSVDPTATRVGLRVLRRGGNATDAAVAVAATLGVTEPFSAGIGGGGYFVHYDADTDRVQTIDGRETAPAAMPRDAFINPETGAPYRFSPELVTSGVSVGVPGTPATWQRALHRWGSRPLGDLLRPAARVAHDGFRVDRTFHDQVADNQVRFRAFRPTRRLYLDGGHAPAVGSVFRNPDLAATYAQLATQGIRSFYRGPLAREIADAVQEPPTSKATSLPVPPGYLTPADLASYRTVDRRPTHVDYRGLDVYGMAPSSSGGTTVGEALNILERFRLRHLAASSTAAVLHRYLAASSLAFADRSAYVGDPAYVDVPRHALLSDRYAAERACLIRSRHALAAPVEPGDVTTYDGRCDTPSATSAKRKADTENVETTNLTVADRWGNVVEYTLTIEQTGGSGLAVPGRGFLLNNELTDFSTVYDPADPNRIQPGKRPRSSMSPTILLRDGKPFLALGSPGGSTIITTVLQVLVNRLALGMDISEAVAAPRATQRNTEDVLVEPAFLRRYRDDLEAYGYSLALVGEPGTSDAQIGAATAIEFGAGGRFTAAAEPVRRGGGAAGVVRMHR